MASWIVIDCSPCISSLGEDISSHCETCPYAVRDLRGVPCPWGLPGTFSLWETPLLLSRGCERSRMVRIIDQPVLQALCKLRRRCVKERGKEVCRIPLDSRRTRWTPADDAIRK